MHGGVPNREFNENNNQCILDKELSSILNELAIDRSLLDKYAQYIIFLLGAGANRDTQNQRRKTLSHYLDKRLSYILGRLAINSDLLDGYIQHIRLLLEAGANPNIQNQDGKTLLHYVAELNDINGIGFLLGKGAKLDVQDQDEKAPLHYAAKNNFLQAILLLLRADAKQDVKDRSGKTPFQYVTKNECRQALKGWGDDLDNFHENEGNPATPDGSVGESNDCSNSSGDDSQVKSVKLSDCNTEEGSRENEENPAKSPDNGNRTLQINRQA